LEQQTATSQVLEVIGGSPGDLRPVFETMLTNATRICEAKFGVLWLSEQERFRCVALHNAPPAFAAHYRDQPLIKPPLGTGLRRVFETRQVTQVSDMTTIKPYIERDPFVVASVELGGYRGVLNAPMLKENELIGAISIYSQEVRLFSDKQIALVTDFAAQAVIAIENARLLNELRQRTTDLTERTADLTEALEQQTATSEVLQAISSSPGDLQLVFQAMLEKAVRICDAKFGSILRWDNEAAHLVATYNAPPAFAEARRLSQNPANPNSGSEKQLESHRREITALFCDLRGFTGFTESADAEDVMALLRDYHAAIGEIIIKYNGTLERYAGDGVMVVFNDPVPVENPALQAVLMALEVREALGSLSATWSRLGHEIGFGIGIAHGFATLGTIGFEGRFDYAAIGTVSNVASRLCDEAKPGQILISPRVLTKVENAVKVEPVGEFELKGIRRPLAAYNVIGAVA
jgi:class 3 adenylate cyclase